MSRKKEKGLEGDIPLCKSGMDRIGMMLGLGREHLELHRKTVDKIVENRRWGIGGYIYATEMQELDKGADLVSMIGVTESGVSGGESVAHLMSFHPKEGARAWVVLDQEERREKFEAEVMPKIDNVVVNWHGWDGQPRVFEMYAGEMLRNVEEKSDRERILANYVVGVEGESESEMTSEEWKLKLNERAEKTLIISISSFGSMGGLSENASEVLNEEGVEVKIIEALDKVGMDMTEIKMKEVRSEKWQNKKRERIESLRKEIMKVKFDDEEVEKRVWKVMEMMLSERKVVSGQWWEEMVSNLNGHSMGGNIAMGMFEKKVTGQRMCEAYQVHRKDMQKKWKARARLNRASLEISEDRVFQTGEIEIAMSDYMGGLLDDFGEKRLSEMKWLSEESIGSKYPHAKWKAWMPVVSGDEGVTVLKDPLLQLVGKLHEWRLGAVRGVAMELLRGPLVRKLVGKYVGSDVPGGDVMIEAYVNSLIMEPKYVAYCTQLLEKMRRVMGNEVEEELSEEKLKGLRIYVGAVDKTLSSSVMLGLKNYLARFGVNVPDGVVVEFADSGHHPSVKATTKIWGDQVRSMREQELARMHELWEVVRMVKDDLSK